MDLFGTDGIRGRAGEGPLAPENVHRLGTAIGYLLKNRPKVFHASVPEWFRTRHPLKTGNILGKGRILIGRDTRESGPAIEEHLVAGLSDFGVGTLQAGVLPTPGVAQMARRWSCILGIVISASHNPAADNGIKLFSPEGLKTSDEAEAAIQELYRDKTFDPKIHHSRTRRIAPPKPMAGRTHEYLDVLLDHLEKPETLSGMKIVADCAHGATSPFVSRLLKKLGIEVEIMNDQPNGRNINHKCGATHPGEMASLTAAVGADLGVAFDGDGDRAILSDEKGRLIDGDHLLAMHAIDLKKRADLPGPAVVGTVMANHGLELCLADYGIRLVRTRVGDRYVTEKMLRDGAHLGGEQSGHIIFLNDSPAGDGMFTMLQTLSLMKREDKSLSELASVLKKSPQMLLNVRVREKPPLDKVEPVRRAHADADSALAGKGRIVLRYSGTEPLCRIMVEGTDKAQIREIAESLADTVRRTLGADSSVPQSG